MGSGAGEKNKQLGQQRQLQNTYANQMGERSQNEYDYRTGTRDYLTGQYKDLAGGAPTLVGGSAAWTNPMAGLLDPVMAGYQDLYKTGGWTPEEMAGYRSWTTAPISGFYQGLKNQLERSNNAIGGYVGYNSQSAKLGRDAARQGFQTAQESESGLQQMIREAKLQGLQGMNQIAQEKMAAYHPGSAGSAGGVGSQDYYLNKLGSLMGGAEDLQYGQMAQGGYNAGADTANNIASTTPLWQQSLASIAPAAANAAIGSFTGGASRIAGAASKGKGWYDTPSTFSWT